MATDNEWYVLKSGVMVAMWQLIDKMPHGAGKKAKFLGRPDPFRDQEVAGSNPVAPTILRNEPFGENVEGLSHCGDETYVIESAVQKDDFEDSTFRRVIGGKQFPCNPHRSWVACTNWASIEPWVRCNRVP